MEKTTMTKDGFLKLKADLQRMETIELKECIQNLSDAREKGDLSENAEYDVARDQLNALNAKMNKLSLLLSNVQIIESVIDDGSVQLLTWVEFKNLKTNQISEWKIVPEYETNLKEGKISPLSPIGKALVGKRPGDKVDIQIPAGTLSVEIIKVRTK